MEYIEGVRIDHVDEIRAMGVDPDLIADRGFYAYLQQIFEDGFFHGDPHPGNLLVSKDGTVNFLDFGIVGIIHPERRFYFTHLFIAMIDHDPELMIKALEQLGVSIEESSGISSGMRSLPGHDECRGSLIGQFSSGQMSQELADTLRGYRIRMPQNLMLMLKVIVMVLDIGVTLDPKFNFWKGSRAIYREVIEARIYRSVSPHAPATPSLKRLTAC